MRRDRAIAEEKLKQLLIDISPMIEEYTARVCPDCRDVCCRQRHSIMNEQDVRYLRALDVPLPAPDPARAPDGPCQFMGKTGCVNPRWLRPWRCTWYFCGPLLDAVDKGPKKKARRLSALIQEIVDLRSCW